MKAAILDGTPAEIAEAMQGLGWRPSETLVAIGLEAEPEHTHRTNDDELPMPRVFAERVLARIPLAQTQKKLMQTVLNSGTTGIFGRELMEKLGYSQAQFRGMMGAFGRRVRNTKGFSEDFNSFFSWEWHSEESSYRYWFEGEVREAVQSALVRK